MLAWSEHGVIPENAITADCSLYDRQVAFGLAHPASQAA